MTVVGAVGAGVTGTGVAPSLGVARNVAPKEGIATTPAEIWATVPGLSWVGVDDDVYRPARLQTLSPA